LSRNPLSPASISIRADQTPVAGFAEVAVAAPLHRSLTYAIPERLAGLLTPGMRVLAPLGRRLVTGYLLDLLEEPPAGHEAKLIAELLDASPLFPENLIPFYRWIASYYRHPLGEVIKTALPGGLSPGSGRRITLTEKGGNGLPEVDHAQTWMARLRKSGELEPSAVRPLWQQARIRRLLENWEKSGLIVITSEVGRDRVGPRSELCIRLALPRETISGLKVSEAKTLELLRRITAESGREWIARKELTREYSGARKALISLLARGVIACEERPVYRDPFGEATPFFPRPDRLSAEQTAALLEIHPAISSGEFRPFLLHGVTGSGKTEIYLQAAEKTLQLSRGVLVLVPEIALATQLEAHFLSRFGDRVALLHSGLSAGERFDQWQRLAQGRAMIAVGARSAVFAPLRNPGLIIVDEEHDGAYKQEEGLLYQARDLAVLRGSLQCSTVLLGSATPAVTSFQHASTGKYRLLTLRSRIKDRPLPEVKIIDLRTIKTISGRPPLFSQPLISAIRENLATGDQSLLFLNRRGFANLLLCSQCGQTLQCRHCQVTLTLHKSRRQLLCHYCGYTVPGATLCSNCQSTALLEIGFGTERVEMELTSLFPRARIARLDRDSSSDRKKYLAVLNAVRQREIDILVGTQMIAKGLHFPHVTLVGVVWADAGMGLPDFKAGERTYQLLAQVTGRTGRGDKPGRVLIQTHQPEHYGVVTARDHDYYSFFNKEITLRHALGYPPFCRLVNLRLEGEKESEVQNAALELARSASHLSRGLNVLGPAPAPIAKLRGRYRWQLLLKGSTVEALQHFCSRLLERPPALIRSNAVKLTVDVDPDNML
jgi:primosomal protein N' (replication factor Y) (superfamily II helicase)